MRVYELAVTADFQPVDLQTISEKANQFASDIMIEVESDEGNRHIIDVKSLLGMLLVPIRKGTKIRLQTKGKDEKEAIDFMSAVIENYKRI